MLTEQEVADMYGLDLSEDAAKNTATDFYAPAEEAIYGEMNTAHSDYVAAAADIQDNYMSDYLQLGQQIARTQSGLSGAAIAQSGVSKEQLGTDLAANELALETTMLGLNNDLTKLKHKAYADAVEIYYKKRGVVNQYREADYQNQIQEEQLALQEKSIKINAALGVAGIAANKAIADAQIAAQKQIAEMNAASAKEIAGMQSDAMGEYLAALGEIIDANGYEPAPPPASSGGSSPPVHSNNDGSVDYDNDGYGTPHYEEGGVLGG